MKSTAKLLQLMRVLWAHAVKRLLLWLRVVLRAHFSEHCVGYETAFLNPGDVVSQTKSHCLYRYKFY